MTLLYTVQDIVDKLFVINIFKKNHFLNLFNGMKCCIILYFYVYMLFEIRAMYIYYFYEITVLKEIIKYKFKFNAFFLLILVYNLIDFLFTHGNVILK